MMVPKNGGREQTERVVLILQSGNEVRQCRRLQCRPVENPGEAVSVLIHEDDSKKITGELFEEDETIPKEESIPAPVTIIEEANSTSIVESDIFDNHCKTQPFFAL